MSAQLIAHEVLSNLTDQVRLYRHLLNLSEAQLAAVRTQDVHSVHAILQEIEMSMLDRARLEMLRADLIRRIAAELGIEIEQVTAARLRQITDASISSQIERAAEELRQVITELDRVVACNRSHLEHELAVVDQMVKGMTVDRTATPTYLRTGAEAQQGRLKLLDAQV